MGTTTNLAYIISIVFFFSMITFLEVDYARSMPTTSTALSGFAELEYPTCSVGVIIIDGMFACAWDYFVTFLALMSVTTEFAVFNIVILVSVIAGLGWAFVTLLRGGGG